MNGKLTKSIYHLRAESMVEEGISGFLFSSLVSVYRKIRDEKGKREGGCEKQI